MSTLHETNIDTRRHRQSRRWRAMINVAMTTAGLTQSCVLLFLLGPRSKPYYQRFKLRHYKLSIRSSPSITRTEYCTLDTSAS